MLTTLWRTTWFYKYSPFPKKSKVIPMRQHCICSVCVRCPAAVTQLSARSPTLQHTGSPWTLGQVFLGDVCSYFDNSKTCQTNGYHHRIISGIQNLYTVQFILDIMEGKTFFLCFCVFWYGSNQFKRWFMDRFWRLNCKWNTSLAKSFITLTTNPYRWKACPNIDLQYWQTCQGPPGRQTDIKRDSCHGLNGKHKSMIDDKSILIYLIVIILPFCRTVPIPDTWRSVVMLWPLLVNLWEQTH